MNVEWICILDLKLPKMIQYMYFPNSSFVILITRLCWRYFIEYKMDYCTDNKHCIEFYMLS